MMWRRSAGAAVLADSAYHTHRRERELLERGIRPLLMRRANKHHASATAQAAEPPDRAPPLLG
jgi:IS5 family transposase